MSAKVGLSEVDEKREALLNSMIELKGKLSANYTVEAGWVLVMPETIDGITYLDARNGIVVHCPSYPIKGYEYDLRRVWYTEASGINTPHTRHGALHAVRVENIYASRAF